MMHSISQNMNMSFGIFFLCMGGAISDLGHSIGVPILYAFGALLLTAWVHYHFKEKE